MFYFVQLDKYYLKDLSGILTTRKDEALRDTLLSLLECPRVKDFPGSIIFTKDEDYSKKCTNQENQNQKENRLE